MILNILKNKKGYTLTYAIIIIGLLLILTASVIMITYMNFKFARTGGQINTSFYASDGALEEALTELSRYSYNAEVKAWEEVNSINYAIEPWYGFLNDIYDDIDADVLSIDEGNQLISDAIRGVFDSTYYNELLDSSAGNPAYHNFYNAGLSGTAKYLDFSGYTGVTFQADAEVKISILTALGTTLFVPDDIIAPSDSNPADVESVTVSDVALTKEIRMTIVSDGTYHEKNKRLSVDVSLLPPDYNFSTSLKTESISLRKNDITDQALAAKGSIFFLEGDTMVDGNIYGYGDQIDFANDQPRQTYGGITVGDGSTTMNVTVTGDVASRNAFNVYAPNSNVSVGSGLYVNNLYFAPSAEDANVTIDKDLYMYSDLFVGANRVSVSIDTSNPDAGLDRLSLNPNEYIPTSGNLVGLLSLHPVAGDGYTRTGSIIVSETVEAPSITCNGLFLNGVVRYNLLQKDHFKSSGDEDAYKTGESFTTNQNKTYYQTLGLGSIYQSGVVSFLQEFIIDPNIDPDDPSNILSLISFNDALDASLDQKEFRAIHYYSMGYNAFIEHRDSSAPYSLNDISAVDKSIIKLRNPVRNPSTSAFYGVNANGIIQFKSAETLGQDGKVYHPDIINTAAISNNQDALSRTIDEKANILGYSDYTNIGSDRHSEVNLFNAWLNNSASPVLPIDASDVKVAVYNNDPSKDIYINYDVLHGGHIDISGQLNVANEIFEGTVVTRGNIYINSSDLVTFRGNLISEKNIYLVGNGQKNIVHDELAIYSAINKSTELRTLYHTTTGRELAVSGTMINNDFTALVQNNSEEINVNSVNDMVNSGTTIIDSRSMRINSWYEE